MQNIKLSEWAKRNGLKYKTAHKLFQDGNLPVPSIQLATGTILVSAESSESLIEAKGCNGSEPKLIKAYTYSRVSTYAKKDDLTRQADRCIDFCTKNGWIVEKSFKEIASGLNDNRPKLKQLLTLLNEGTTKLLVVEHKDRLTRFGFGYFEWLLPMLGVTLVVINRDAEDETDLMKDFIAIITSFCCRLYGLRRSTRKTQEIKKILLQEDSESDNKAENAQE